MDVVTYVLAKNYTNTEVSSAKTYLENYTNQSVATNTAYYISNNGQPFSSVEDLEAYSGEVSNNDYTYVVSTDQYGNTLYNRYKYNSNTEQWAYEFTITSDSFNQSQWNSINSGVDTAKVQQIETNRLDIVSINQTLAGLDQALADLL